MGGLRIVHATWNDDAIRTVGALQVPYDDATLLRLIDENTKEGHAAEVLANGIRLTLPGDLFAVTHRGVPLNWMRAKWWIPCAGNYYDDLAFPDLDVVPRKLIENKTPKPTAPARLYDGYPAEAPPVFFGHYSLPALATLGPQAANVACIDFSVWKSGPLVAYRWDGESVLRSDKFISSAPSSTRPGSRG